jgi:hypothetical protein
MSALDLLLSVPTLMEMVEQFPSVDGPMAFEQLFKLGDQGRAEGTRAIFTRYANDRRLSPVRSPSGQAYLETAPDQAVIDVGFIHTACKEVIQPEHLYSRAGYGLIMAPNAAETVMRALKRCYARAHRTREYICARLLQDASGVTISPSAAAWVNGANEVTTTVTIPGTFQSYTIGEKWDVETSRPFSDTSQNQLPGALNTLEANGHRAQHLIMNRFVAAALQGNLEAQTFLVNQGASPEILRQALVGNATRQGEDGDLSGSIFNGLGGVEYWHDLNHGYVNGAGTFTRYLDSDKAVLLPEDLDKALGFCEGPVYVPNMQQVIGAEAADELFSVRVGMQAYAYRTVDDVGSIVIVVRDSFRPMVKDNLGALLLSGVR